MYHVLDRLPIALIVLFLSGNRLINAADTLPVSDVMARASSNVRMIDSMKLTWTVQEGDGKLSAPTQFTLSGGRYRIDEATGNATAFDGKSRQILLKRESVLTINSEAATTINPYGVMNPLVWAYAWLLPHGTPLTWGNLKSVEHWQETFRSAMPLRNESLDEDGVCDVLQFERPNETNPKIEVWFARGSQSFPVRWRRASAKGEDFPIDVRASKIKKVTHRAGDSFVPMTLSIKQTGSDGGLPMNRTFRVSEPDLHLNITIPDDTFHIPRHLASEVIDIQEQFRYAEEVEKPYLESAKKEQQGRTRYRSIAIVVAVLLSMAGLVYYRIHRKHS